MSSLCQVTSHVSESELLPFQTLLNTDSLQSIRESFRTGILQRGCDGL
jgi:hypothetical protein